MATLFEFDLAGQTHRLSIRNQHFYVLDDGSQLPVRVWPAWCEHCRAFILAEQILPGNEEDDELRELEYFAERPGLIPPDRHLRLSQIPELRVRKRWRSKRVAPPKCLTCGSIGITSIWPGAEVDIPGRGACVGRFCGWADMSGGPPGAYDNAYYNPEGDRIARSP